MSGDVHLRLSRFDYERLNNLLGNVAALGRYTLEGLSEDALRSIIEMVPRQLTAADCARLVHELDRQATLMAED